MGIPEKPEKADKAGSPHDALAEHPLSGPDPRPARRSQTLSLFPDISETPYASPAASASPAAPPASPSAPPESGGKGSTRREPLQHVPFSSVLNLDVDEPGEPILDEAPADAEAPVAFARRVAAGLADLVILGLFGAVEVAAGAFVLDLRFPPPALLGVGAFLFLAATVLLVLVPFVWGTTPGMALADLRVRAEDGGSPTLASAFLRFLGFLLTGLLAGVPLLVAAFDRRGRTLADLLSRTTLVNAR